MSKVKAITILLAEDNEDHAELMLDVLNEFNVGNIVNHVRNGEEVLQYLRNEPPFDQVDCPEPDLILLDIKMPRLDGIEVLEVIKSDEALRHLPVVMMTTSTTDEEIKKAYKLGANSYITKPLQFEEFAEKVKQLNLYWVLTSELPSHPPAESSQTGGNGERQ